MSEEDPKPSKLQQLYDRPLLLLALGMLVMLVFYTGWGLYEILSLPTALLP
ncbi:MAG: hypothetical protein IPL79_10785 [Myxococcales bacterium]|nr:hypothetical protein [Myxococcales bacterium]